MSRKQAPSRRRKVRKADQWLRVKNAGYKTYDRVRSGDVYTASVTFVEGWWWAQLIGPETTGWRSGCWRSLGAAKRAIEARLQHAPGRVS